MNPLAFVILFLLSPEQDMTRALRSVKEVTVAYGGQLVVLKQPGPLLAKLRVTSVARIATSGKSPCRIWFGSFGARPFWIFDPNLTTDDECPLDPLCVELAPGFTEALNEELSRRLGRKVDVRKKE